MQSVTTSLATAAAAANQKINTLAPRNQFNASTVCHWTLCDLIDLPHAFSPTNQAILAMIGLTRLFLDLVASFLDDVGAVDEA